MQPEATVDGNLGEAQQNERLRLGVGMFALGLAIAVGMLKLDVPLLFRVVLFLPFGVGSGAIFMGLYGT